MAASDNDEFPVFTSHPVFGGIATFGYNLFAAPALWFNKKIEAIRGEPEAFYHRYGRIQNIIFKPLLLPTGFILYNTKKL